MAVMQKEAPILSQTSCNPTDVRGGFHTDAGDFMSARSSPHPAQWKIQTPAVAAVCPEHPDTPSQETTVVLRQYLFLAGPHLGMISRHDWVTHLDPLIRHSLWDKKCCQVAKDHLCKYFDARDDLATSALKRCGRRAELAPQLLRSAKPNGKICV